ncbi:MAG: type IVB secretion system coupling complex protein DotM/IcmP [Gammaproteobacteria bacterium]|nr:type IVB secretion system coupling complex protein DotM/IcmP [Gammaproteobacteria bacterium]MCH9744104.1 type IVB secretion system coupling complex protein DotM/IcmP [Gammaproteobacteria bacterium]
MYPSQQNATDQTANFFWVLVMIIGAMLLVWWLARQYIVIPIYTLRHVEINMIIWFASIWDPVAHALHLPAIDLANLEKLQAFMTTSDPKLVEFKDFSVINSYVGAWIRYPVALVLLILSGAVFLQGGNTRFRHKYNMQKLKKVGVENWPEIAPVLSLDLVKQDIETGPWAMAKLPLHFGKEHDLVHVIEKDQRKVWSLNRAPAQQAFTMQLGPLWQGVDVLPIHIKALIIIFIARAQRERAVASKLLKQIAASAASGKLDFSGVEEYIRKYKHSKIIKWLEGRHAYVYTLLATMLEIARVDGVLATAEFLWLKPVDRRLWYVLNSVGRQTSVVEVSGPYSHWLAEKKVGRALKTPMVKAAVDALEDSMLNTLFVPEEDSWRTYKEA